MSNATEQIFLLNPPDGQATGVTQKNPGPTVQTQINLHDVQDFSSVCRTCATVTQYVIPIFEGDGLENNLADKIHKHLPIQVSETDVLPRVVCYQCASTLLAWHELVQCCVQADAALRTRLGVAPAVAVSAPPAPHASHAALTPMYPVASSPGVSITIGPGVSFSAVAVAPPPVPAQAAGPAPAAAAPVTRPRRERPARPERPGQTVQTGRATQTDPEPSAKCATDMKREQNNQSFKWNWDGNRETFPAVSNDTCAYTFSSDELDATDDDDRPLSTIAGKKADMYSDFYTALVNFRNHFVGKHGAERRLLTESSDSEIESDEEKVTDDGNVDNYDDLSQCNMRKDRLDEDTRVELSEVQTKIDGKVFYTCRICGKNLSSSHTYVFHKRIHTGERPCVCHVCGKQFRAPNGLQRHLTETHDRARRHPCRLCLKDFANTQNLKQHLRIHTGERPHACPHCGKRFTQSGSLHAHLKTHGGPPAHRCGECGARFRLRSSLTRHALKHSGERPHACAQCGRAFRQRHELAAHALQHSDARPFACAHCGAAFRQRRALRHHARRLHEPAAPRDPPAPPDAAPSLVYACYGPTECPALAEYVEQTLRPPDPYGPDGRRRCAFCDERFTREAYDPHVVATHSQDLFHCRECDTYVDRKVFILHMSIHAVDYTVRSELRESMARVKRVIETNPRLRIAIENGNIRPAAPRPRADRSAAAVAPPQPQPPPPPPSSIDEDAPPARADPGPAPPDEFADASDAEDGFGALPDSVFDAIDDPPAAAPPPGPARPPRACPVCGKTYRAASSYFYHVKHAHGARREHACDACPRRFATRALLAQHRPLHTGERAHACAVCGKRFAARAGLYVHAQTHAAAARWRCAQCPRAFRWRAQLRRHAARHAGARPHACAACPRAFSVRADLLRHAATHAPAALPCPRPACAARFAQPRYLRVHLRRKHNLDPDEPAAGN